MADRDARGRFARGRKSINPRQRLDWKRVMELLEEYHGDVNRVAAKVKCSTRQVERIRARMDPDYVPAKRDRWTPEFEVKLKAALWEGWGYHQTAETYGVDQSHLARRFPGFGLSPSEAGQRAHMVRAFNEVDASLRKVS